MKEVNVTVAEIAKVIKKMNKKFMKVGNGAGIYAMNDFADNIAKEIQKETPGFNPANFFSYCKGVE